MVRNASRQQKTTQSDYPKSTKHDEETIISSTTEITKKIKKPNKKKLSISKKKNNSPSVSDNQSIPSMEELLVCKEHNYPIEFICKNQLCIKHLCSHCILTHTEHISHIVAIKTFLKDTLEHGKNPISNPSTLLSDLNHNLESHTKIVDSTIKQVIDVINKVSTIQRGKLINAYEEARSTIKNLANFNTTAIEILDDETNINRENLEVIKTYLRNSEKIQKKQSLTPNFQINSANMLLEVEKALENNMTLSSNTPNLETTISANSPKVLHWFEWGKKRLNLYNIATNTTKYIDLDISFKIPSFSRSLIVPDGKIYLIGGEEPEYFSRKEVYMYDHVANDRKLHEKAPMINKKFDFTLCHLNGFIFVMCGKDSSSEVVDTCEKYSLIDNYWTAIAPVKKKRYAASAVGFTNNRIYLFGGRSDVNNTMVGDIEEYNVDTNEWNILNIQNFHLWNPVEVCACIQITEDHILVFGGSDARIKDSNNSLVLDVRNCSFERKGELKKAQVFVNPPFFYKGHVYALGNEYYMKHRNLHRYSIEKEEWEIIFQVKERGNDNIQQQKGMISSSILGIIIKAMDMSMSMWTQA